MKPYEQIELWRHGFRFVIRRVPYKRYTPRRFNWRAHQPYNSGIGQFCIFLNGKFKARVKSKQLKRWINHFALEALVKP